MTRKLSRLGVLAAIALALCAAMDAPAKADPAAIMGSGNFANGDTGPLQVAQYAAIKAAGGRMARFASYNYWDDTAGVPRPEFYDSAMKQARMSGITPMILFEYYGSFQVPPVSKPLGGYDKWHAIGSAFAERFRPNSSWWLDQGVSDFGMTIFAAINEPDLRESEFGVPKISKAAYREALRGLADGVHSVDASLKVIPGGFMRANAYLDYTLDGYCPNTPGQTDGIVDLLNNGTLDGLDLHTYSSYWAPAAPANRSAQHDFDAVKKACGITRNINFYATEFNYATLAGEGGDAPMDIGEDAAASYFLTNVWDHLGVAGRSDSTVTSVTKLAFVWNLFTDSEPTHRTATSLAPWTPNARGKVYQMVAQRTTGMSFTTVGATPGLDPVRTNAPNATGKFLLTGAGKRMWVWQNRQNWTGIPAAQRSTWPLKGIPAGTVRLELYGWDGLRQVVPITKQTSYTFADLPGNETYMAVATSRTTAVNAGGFASGAYRVDDGFTLSNVHSDPSSTITTTDVSLPAPANVYQSCRWAPSFNYTVTGLTAGHAYIVRLHFAELTWTAAGQRRFHVAMNGQTVLTDFDIVAAAGGAKKAVVREFTGVANASGQIVIEFSKGEIDNPMISAIEVLN